jgi:hypothetical protein
MRRIRYPLLRLGVDPATGVTGTVHYADRTGATLNRSEAARRYLPRQTMEAAIQRVAALGFAGGS